VKAGLGSLTQRLSSDSQLPFGHCCLSLHPVRDAVISPSGHIYEREVILEYLLNKTRELKLQHQAYEEEQVLSITNFLTHSGF
jgi:nitric oxide synthase-interacting protein